MKIKIGNRIYDGDVTPVMVILTPKDRENIANMDSDATCYAYFPKEWCGRDVDMLAWMNDSEENLDLKDDSVELFSADEIQELYEDSIVVPSAAIDHDESFGDSLGRFLNNPIG